MTKDQLSLLLYLETCAVDFGGSVDVVHMNADDQTQAATWHDSGFIEYGRIASDHFPKQNGRQRTNYVRLSDAAWTAAHEERKARCSRLWDRRRWQTTQEKAARPMVEEASV